MSDPLARNGAAISGEFWAATMSALKRSTIAGHNRAAFQTRHGRLSSLIGFRN
jgi:hypothetical protein